LPGSVVATEIALSFILLVGAGLLTQTLFRLAAQPLGFDARNLLTVALRMPPSVQADNRLRVYEEATERLRTLPGVKAVAGVSATPFDGLINSSYIEMEGALTTPTEQRPLARRRNITPNYFETVGIPLIEGRAFTVFDDVRGSDVMIVNKTMAKNLWPNDSPIEKRVRIGSPRWYRIVGVVDDIRDQNLSLPPENMAYLTYSQSATDRVLVIRTSVDPMQLAGAVRSEIRAMERNIAFTRVDSMDNMIAGTLSANRYRAFLIGVFAIASGLLAAAGLYSVVSRTVVRRTRELGIRIALGAQRSSIAKLVLGQSLLLTTIGIVVGSAGAAAVTRFIASALFGVTPLDPLTYAGIAVILFVVAVGASYFPLRRAWRVDPVEAIRSL
jgi:putative ABC transport system permease protein